MVLLIAISLVHWYGIYVQRVQWIKLKKLMKEQYFSFQMTTSLIMKFCYKEENDSTMEEIKITSA